MFRAVWLDEGLDSISRKSCAKKFNLVPILAETLSGASEANEEERRGLLAALNDALEPLLKRTSELKIRPISEQGTILLGSALSLVNTLPKNDALRDSLTICFATIFRAVLFDDRATKKLAKAFFKYTLCPALMYLANSKPEHPTTIAIESCVQETIFSADNLVDYINAIDAAVHFKQGDLGFASLVNSLTASEISDSFDGIPVKHPSLTLDVLCLPILLNLGLRALTPAHPKLSLDQKSLLASTFLSSFESFSSQSTSKEPQTTEMIIAMSTQYLRKLCGLLQVLHDTAPPSSLALSGVLTTTATTALSFLDFTDVSVAMLAWDALTWIIKIDFDIVLEMMEDLEPRLEVTTVAFFQSVIETNFKLRTGVEFIQRWTELLNLANVAGREGGTLGHPTVLSSYPSTIEPSDCRICEEVRKNLASTQIQEVLLFFIDNIYDEGSTIPMKTVLRGIKSLDNIEHITPFIREDLAPVVQKKLLKGRKATDAGFEIYFLLLELSDSLTLELFSYKVLRTALRLCRKSQSLFAVCWRRLWING